MLGNIIDTNQYFESLVLNDKRREQLFADMMNTLYIGNCETSSHS